MNKKYALCIGNNYPGTSAELRGCVNDAHDWAQLLRGHGYQAEVLEEASRDQMLAALTILVHRIGYGDRLVVCYSGHGTYVPDRSGDEIDGRDEALVMADYANGGLIIDDDLQRVFSGAERGAGALLLSDSCHSGTVTRFLGAPLAQGTPRWLPPADFMDLDNDEVNALAEAPTRTLASTYGSPYVSLISGCADDEYSYDASFNGRPNGAFSRAAIDAYVHGVSLNQWFTRIRDALPTSYYPQTPQLTAASSYRKYLRAL